MREQVQMLWLCRVCGMWRPSWRGWRKVCCCLGRQRALPCPPSRARHEPGVFRSTESTGQYSFQLSVFLWCPKGVSEADKQRDAL